MKTAADAVQALLEAVGHSEALDNDIHDYICSVIEDSDPESSLDLLISVLSECVGAFGALGNEQQAQLVLQLLDDVSAMFEYFLQAFSRLQQAFQAVLRVVQAKAASGAQAPSTASAADDDSIQAVVAALRQAKLQCHELPDPCSDIINTRAAAGSFSSSSSDSCSAKAPDLGPLLELCPAGISSQFVQHCLPQNLQGDMQVSLLRLAVHLRHHRAMQCMHAVSKLNVVSTALTHSLAHSCSCAVT